MDRGYLNTVYRLLADKYPREFTQDEVYDAINRANFTSPLRFVNIARHDNRFQLNKNGTLSLTNRPAATFNVNQRVQEFYNALREKYCDSVLRYREDTIRNDYKRMFRNDLHFERVRNLLLRQGKWIYTEGSRRVYFDFMIANLERDEHEREDRNGIVVKAINNLEFQIKNDSNAAVEMEPYVQAGRFQIREENRYPIQVQPGRTVNVKLSCTQITPGIYCGEVLFAFYNSNLGEFVIRRPLRRTLQNNELRAILQPTTPYVRPEPPARTQLNTGTQFNGNRPKPPRRQHTPGTQFIGIRPVNSSRKFLVLLDEFKIPGNYFDPEAIGIEEETLLASLIALQQFAVDKTIGTTDHIIPVFGQHYRSMLYFEEAAMIKELLTYSSHNVAMRREGHSEFFWLDVPGLAESRPSVLRGDSVKATCVGDPENHIYKGFVWQVEQTRIRIHFHANFAASYSAKACYNVEYSYKRTSLNIMHDTLRRIAISTNSAAVAKIIFPKVDEGPVLPNPIDDVDLEGLNYYQKLAVKSIVRKATQDPTIATAPFILFGPPGTGKTSTLVASIKQIMMQAPTSKLLLLAPSNQAADLLVEKLSDTFRPEKMFRLMSYQRDRRDISATVLRYCTGDEFIIPPNDVMTSYSLLVSTCSMASKLFYYKFPANHFDAIIIDESGHCWEPEALASFMNFYSSPPQDLKLIQNIPIKSAKLILAGDHQQLGPVVRSHQGNTFGLGLSLLERFMNYEIYSRDIDRFPETSGYNPRYIVQLTDCYRCHPEIIALPNRFFYNNTLVVKAHPEITNTFHQWEHLPNPSKPLIFCGCVGENEREGNSPSWFNTLECEMIVSYLKLLRNRVAWKDIGIITPYSKQKQKIRKAILTIQGITTENGPMVGSCEQFQGQERKVIIISTVRSSVELLKQDERFNLGFVSNPKRFNVAITRAQALVIVIGNPNVLKDDPHWGALLWSCIDNGCYTGCDVPPREEPQENNNDNNDNNNA